MVKQKTERTGVVTRIARRNALHLISFGFVAGRMKCTGIPFQDAVGEFIEHFGLGNEINPESMEREIRRMTVEYMNEGV